MNEHGPYGSATELLRFFVAFYVRRAIAVLQPFIRNAIHLLVPVR